jgi:hypothetical protein
MQWAPDPTDLWAPDSERARAWASDSNGHLTLIQAIDLFLAAKAAEGVDSRRVPSQEFIADKRRRGL